jgi:hypothetical protein
MTTEIIHISNICYNIRLFTTNFMIIANCHQACTTRSHNLDIVFTNNYTSLVNIDTRCTTMAVIQDWQRKLENAIDAAKRNEEGTEFFVEQCSNPLRSTWITSGSLKQAQFFINLKTHFSFPLHNRKPILLFLTCDFPPHPTHKVTKSLPQVCVNFNTRLLV